MEEKKELNAEATALEKRKKQIILAVLLGVLVICGVIGGILYNVYGGQGTIGGMLQIYYETMYSNNGKSFDDLCDCLAPELQSDYYISVTAGGINFTQLNKWRAEAIVEVGENVKVDVKVLKKTPAATGALAALKQELEYAEELVNVEFQVTLTGDNGYVKMKGQAACVREGSDWYLSTETVELETVERSEET